MVKYLYAPVAQRIEQVNSNHLVGGSIPSGRTNKNYPTLCGIFCLWLGQELSPSSKSELVQLEERFEDTKCRKLCLFPPGVQKVIN